MGFGSNPKDLAKFRNIANGRDDGGGQSCPGKTCRPKHSFRDGAAPEQSSQGTIDMASTDNITSSADRSKVGEFSTMDIWSDDFTFV